MKDLVRIEILLDSAHRPALEHFLRDRGLSRSLFAERIEAPSFDTSLMGASRLVAFSDPEAFEAARPELVAFLKTCGAAAFLSRSEELLD